MTESFLIPLAIAAAALAAGLTRRARHAARLKREEGRHEQTEHLLELLSTKQPGVWDKEELIGRIVQTAKEFWTAPTRSELEKLAMWVNPELMKEALREWPRRAVRREATLRFEAPLSFVHVREGGLEPDCLVARLMSRSQTTFLDDKGRRLGGDRRPKKATYHTWLHIDGQGWHLETISDDLPSDDPAPSSVSCRISELETTEELER